jgi:hypothetical protein
MGGSAVKPNDPEDVRCEQRYKAREEANLLDVGVAPSFFQAGYEDLVPC